MNRRSPTPTGNRPLSTRVLTPPAPGPTTNDTCADGGNAEGTVRTAGTVGTRRGATARTRRKRGERGGARRRERGGYLVVAERRHAPVLDRDVVGTGRRELGGPDCHGHCRELRIPREVQDPGVQPSALGRDRLVVRKRHLLGVALHPVPNVRRRALDNRKRRRGPLVAPRQLVRRVLLEDAPPVPLQVGPRRRHVGPRNRQVHKPGGQPRAVVHGEHEPRQQPRKRVGHVLLDRRQALEKRHGRNPEVLAVAVAPKLHPRHRRVVHLHAGLVRRKREREQRREREREGERDRERERDRGGQRGRRGLAFSWLYP